MIHITSKLSKSETRHLRRAAQRYESLPLPSKNNTDYLAFGHFARNAYAPLVEGVSEHDVARRMMVIAGTTFEYEIIK